MDDIYYLTGQSCFSMFPLSFYYTHTPEEIEQITLEEIVKVKELIDQMKPSASVSAPIGTLIERYNIEKTIDGS